MIDVFLYLVNIAAIKMQQLAWKDAGWWLAFTVVGFVAPIGVGTLVRWALGGTVDLEWIAGGGQFAFASAGLMMTAYYFVARPSPIPRMPHTGWFLLFSLVCLLSAATFVILATMNFSGASVDGRSYLLPSIVLFIVTLMVVFVAVGVDNTRAIDDPQFLEEQRQIDIDAIEDDFDATF